MDDVTNPYAHLIDGPMDIVIPRQVGIYAVSYTHLTLPTN